MTTAEAEARPIRSLIPARLDRLRWSPFHTRLALGPLFDSWGRKQMTAAEAVARG
jgi:hypothetical protein